MVKKLKYLEKFGLSGMLSADNERIKSLNGFPVLDPWAAAEEEKQVGRFKDSIESPEITRLQQKNGQRLDLLMADYVEPICDCCPSLTPERALEHSISNESLTLGEAAGLQVLHDTLPGERAFYEATHFEAHKDEYQAKYKPLADRARDAYREKMKTDPKWVEAMSV